MKHRKVKRHPRSYVELKKENEHLRNLLKTYTSGIKILFNWMDVWYAERRKRNEVRNSKRP